MAYPTAVNAQITDAVSQVNVKVLGDAPAMSMSELYQASAQALSTAAQNAAAAQQQASTIVQASTTQGVGALYSVDTASTGKAAQHIYSASLLTGPELSTEQLESLKQENDLHILFITDSNLSDEFLESLKNMTHLQILHLSNIPVTDAILNELRESLPKTQIFSIPQGIV